MILFVVALAVVTPSGDVFVDGRPHDAPPAVEVADHLAEGDVMTLRVRGFGAFALAEIRQCQRDESSGALGGCTNSFPVQFGVDGTARFQYELQQPAPCGPTDSCVIEISDPNHTALVYTVFGAAAPERATVRLDPEGPYEVGDRISVRASGLADGTRSSVQLCLPECGRAITTEGDPVSLQLASRCPRGEACFIRVTGIAVRDTVIPIRFVAPPGVDYDAAQVAGGLLLAIALSLIAWVLVRRTDWSAPTEAATPAMDAAEL